MELKAKNKNMKKLLLFSNFINEGDNPLDRNKDAINNAKDKIKDIQQKMSDIKDAKKEN